MDALLCARWELEPFVFWLLLAGLALAAVVVVVVVEFVAVVGAAALAGVSVVPFMAADWAFSAPLLPLEAAWFDAEAEDVPPALFVVLIGMDELGVVAEALTAAEAAATPASVAAADVAVFEVEELPACALEEAWLPEAEGAVVVSAVEFEAAPAVVAAVCMCKGIILLFNAGWMLSSCGVKLKRGGKSRPFGNLLLGSRSSSKKLWAHASKGVMRADGVYSKSLLTKWMASGGVRGRNTLFHGWARICGNLNSW